MPIAPVPLFGIVQKLSLGHAVTTILIAMVAMMLTAFSYGRMAALYPSAGSAYTYVGPRPQPAFGLSGRLGDVSGLPAGPADLHYLWRPHGSAAGAGGSLLWYGRRCSRAR